MRDKIKKFFHDYLGWGYPKSKRAGDVFQPTYNCRFCDKEITLDSQMNWFHLK